uniref:Uncharacterized protein n=1 Tax=Candidatus Kentrum sp. MB TaxID=2138164 RepID=A0A451BEA5_9GAMM|nr:MAG: hypothetical protein BECKMB1821G_GA0114241_10698 [Candidatus Kentron sp. MB]VFK34242.1 MAG: hypothetical protein BECKMB1821I_GA0114274_10667 [Candidatus Kentron sp. MB]VFK76606.1 MAG: hypothetical protein BECKMB1821H_GA0114242_10659 [Candidatus Kentron sp. MB]
MGKKIYEGSNWFTEKKTGRIDDDGNTYEGSNWFTEEKTGRIDDDGNIYKGSNWFTEKKTGRIDDDGNVYEGSSWFSERKVGRIDDDGNVYEGTNWFTEKKVGRQEDDDRGSGCFLSTACIEHAGLDDDCSELRTLRQFRDTFVKSLPSGDQMLEDYYRNAPGIVSNISQSDKKEYILNSIYSTIRKAVSLIRNKKNHEALSCYREMYMELVRKFG